MLLNNFNIRNMFFTLFLVFTITVNASGLDSYSITSLPNTFFIDFFVHGSGMSSKAIFNDKGEVAGCISQKRSIANKDNYMYSEKFVNGVGQVINDPCEGAVAAIWSPKKGITSINLPGYKTFAQGINNSGYAAVCLYEDKLSHYQKKYKTVFLEH